MELMKVEMADGKYKIEQIPEGDKFKITIYESGHKVISMSSKTAENYGGLSKMLVAYTKLFKED